MTVATSVTVQGIVDIDVSEVFIAVGMKSTTFWDITSYVSEEHAVSNFRVKHYSNQANTCSLLFTFWSLGASFVTEDEGGMSLLDIEEPPDYKAPQPRGSTSYNP
jgi:hypothetical protein